jgi:hypothetical protein
MPVALIGASKNAKAINALLVAYNDLVKKEKLADVVDVGIVKENAEAFLKACAAAQKMLVETRARYAKPVRGDGTVKVSLGRLRSSLEHGSAT